MTSLIRLTIGRSNSNSNSNTLPLKVFASKLQKRNLSLVTTYLFVTMSGGAIASYITRGANLQTSINPMSEHKNKNKTIAALYGAINGPTILPKAILSYVEKYKNVKKR
jgi:hypothetical protein